MPVIHRDDAPGEFPNHVDTLESPSKANLSVASCINSHLPNRTAASVPIQNKAYHSSPLYYDYTENFFNEARERDHAAELEGIPPPPFLVEKTIHEDRELSSDWSYLAMTDLQGRGFLANEQLLVPHEDSKNVTSRPTDISYVGGGKQPLQDGSELVLENTKHYRSLESTKSPTLEHNLISTKSNPSLLQSIESSSGTENSKSRSLVRDIPPRYTEPEIQHNEAVSEPTLSSISPCAVSPRLQQLFSPPSGLIRSFTDSGLPISSQGAAVHDVKRKPLSRDVSETDQTDSDGRSGDKLDLVAPTQAPQPLQTRAISPVLQRSISAQNKRDKSSPYFRARPNSTSSTQPDTITEILNPSTKRWDLSFDESGQNYAEESSDTKQSSSMSLRRYKQPFQHSMVKFPARKYKSDSSLAVPRNEFAPIQASGKSNQHGNSGGDFGQAGPCDKTAAAGGRDDFSTAGVVSPIPFYPGHQFLVPPTMDDSKPQSKTPVLLETTTLSGEAPITLPEGETSVGPTTPHFFSKFRLKPRAHTVRPKLSPPVTRRRNLDGSYPLDDRRRDVQMLPTSSLRRPIHLAPKLKLKVARASVSSLGTVRINREAAVQADLGDSEILSPEDLFTPPPRLASLFRQVSRHFRPKDEYEEIKVPEITSVGELGETGFPVILSNPEQASGGAARMNGPYPQILPRSSAFVNIPTSPYPLISREPSQDGKGPETSQGAEQLPHNAALMPAVQAGGTQSCFSDCSSQLEESSHLQSNMLSFQPEQPNHHLGTGNKQTPGAAAWGLRDPWDQFQANQPVLDFSEMDDEFDHAPSGPSHRLKTTVGGWLEDIKTTMFGCGRSRR